MDKPKRIQRHLERTKFRAEDVMFVDDSVDNCRAVSKSIPGLTVYKCQSDTGLTRRDCENIISLFNRLPALGSRSTTSSEPVTSVVPSLHGDAKIVRLRSSVQCPLPARLHDQTHAHSMSRTMRCSQEAKIIDSRGGTARRPFMVAQTRSSDILSRTTRCSEEVGASSARCSAPPDAQAPKRLAESSEGIRNLSPAPLTSKTLVTPPPMGKHSKQVSSVTQRIAGSKRAVVAKLGGA